MMGGTWTLERGATLCGDGSVRFRVWAPHAESLRVRVRTGPAAGTYAMTAGSDGVHEATVAGVGAGADYVYVSADGRELPDPVSRWQPDGVHGPSRVVDPAAYAWRDASWRGIPLADYAIYELHVGTFTPEGTFDAAIRELPRLVALGVTAIELMPVAQFPGERNWGYDGVHLYAVQHSYGGAEGLKRLVDAAHGHGLAVVLDVVYNHLGPEGNYLDSFGPFFTERYLTPWGRAVNYDGAHSGEVRQFVIDNARHWVTEYHVDALRLDAVHGIFDHGALHVLEELTAAVHAVAREAGRPAFVIAESDLNDPRLLRPVEQGGYGLDAQWSDDFHHAVHSVLTGERSGYYEDYGGLDKVAAALAEPFVYAGDYSAHRKRRHGAPSVGLPRERFVVAIQNHDQVGNRAAGERLGALVAPAVQRVAAALLLLSPYVPLLFMGEEYGETKPFQYFISHSDRELVESVRKGRRQEFAAFGWGDAVPDPHDEDTFRRSVIDPSVAAVMPHSGILALYRDLLTLRRSERTLRPDGAESRVTHDAANGWIALHRTPHAADGREYVALFNLCDVEHSVPLPDGAARAWRLRLSTDALAYGGEGRLADASAGGVIRLPPWTAVLLEREGANMAAPTSQARRTT